MPVWAGVFGLAGVQRGAHCSTRATTSRARPTPTIRSRSSKGWRGCPDIGRNNFSPRANTIDRVQVADTLTWASGAAHAEGRGSTFSSTGSRNGFPDILQRLVHVPQSRLVRARASRAGRASLYRQSFAGQARPGRRRHPDLREYSLFVQDDWKPRSDVTLSLGVRYDQMRPTGRACAIRTPHLSAAAIDTGRFPTDRNNFGPRLGIAWSPARRPVRPSRRLGTVLRANPDGHGLGRGREQRLEHRFP